MQNMCLSEISTTSIYWREILGFMNEKVRQSSYNVGGALIDFESDFTGKFTGKHSAKEGKINMHYIFSIRSRIL